MILVCTLGTADGYRLDDVAVVLDGTFALYAVFKVGVCAMAITSDASCFWLSFAVSFGLVGRARMSGTGYA